MPDIKMTDIKNKIREFVLGRFRGYDLQDDENLFSSGYVTSLFAMQLVVFVEQAFGIQVESEDLDIQNFSSIQALGDFVLRKTVQPA
ncbi:acyl carrier protein [Deinococcus roseus]|uniref:Carrier domain-containing protein n=1 Tax=Deinococcus roseus TaxID=392414 RepID=A0ABQ2DED8_9DEIO|nr:acyl carrier protein [Deinococcus roseus]GGJ52760.1 hypothetical protein GCM10008938_43400 [Deinococcus roseus]